jgi:hypothetical protein
LTEKAFLGAYGPVSAETDEHFADIYNRTPYGLDVSLPNKERGVFHIEKGNYWKLYNLEYAQSRSNSQSDTDIAAE